MSNVAAGAIVAVIIVILLITNILTPILVGILQFFGKLISSLFSDKPKIGGKSK